METHNRHKPRPLFDVTVVKASNETPPPPTGEIVVPYGNSAVQDITGISMLKPYTVLHHAPVLKLGELLVTTASMPFENLFELDRFLRAHSDILIYQLLERIINPTSSKYLLRYYAGTESTHGVFVKPLHFPKIDRWVLKKFDCYSKFVQFYFKIRGYK